jgi:CBS-domain-containing membrane protein
MLVREVMSTSPVTFPLGTSIQSALQVLAEARVTAVPVVTGHGRMCGIVSEADLILDRVPLDPRLHEIPDNDVLPDRHVVVDEVMSRHVVSVGPDTDLAEAVDLLISTTVKSLPVVARDGRVLGMVSRSDVVRMLAASDDDLERDVDAPLVDVGLRDWDVTARDGSVQLTGPEDSSAGDLARAAACTVPGVLSVRVRVG